MDFDIACTVTFTVSLGPASRKAESRRIVHEVEYDSHRRVENSTPRVAAGMPQDARPRKIENEGISRVLEPKRPVDFDRANHLLLLFRRVTWNNKGIPW